MNLQFSLTTNVSGNIAAADGMKVDSRGSQDSSLLKTVRNSTELSRLERQGVSVPLGDERLIQAIDKAVKALQGPSTTLDISIHEKTHQIMVKVLDKETGETIREVPPEKTLDLVAKMMEIAGILVDEKV